MTKLIQIIALFVVSLSTIAQDSEFTIHDNGLIYDERTMTQLGRIVDSLNLRFKTCEPKQYYAFAQGFATKVIVKNDIPRARQAMNNDMPLDEFLKQFHVTENQREWVIKYRYTDYSNKKILEYAGLPLRKDSRLSIELSDRTVNDKTQGWVFEEYNGNLVGLHLEDVRPRPIPGQYGQLIQYVDCMIDTTAQIYLTDKREYEPQLLSPDSKITQYLEFVRDFKGEPEMPEIDWDSPFAETQYNKFIREHEQWNNARLAWLDEKMRDGHYYRSLLMDASKEALDNRSGDDELEFYVERYLYTD
jgi:hypothetical protein